MTVALAEGLQGQGTQTSYMKKNYGLLKYTGLKPKLNGKKALQ